MFFPLPVERRLITLSIYLNEIQTRVQQRQLMHVRLLLMLKYWPFVHSSANCTWYSELYDDDINNLTNMCTAGWGRSTDRGVDVVDFKSCVCYIGRQEESMAVILKCNGRCMELKLSQNNNYTYAFPGKNAPPRSRPLHL